MSRVQPGEDEDLSYWHLVHCGVCCYPFLNPSDPNLPPRIPFWLTECGHVICNNHLSNETFRDLREVLEIAASSFRNRSDLWTMQSRQHLTYTFTTRCAPL